MIVVWDQGDHDNRVRSGSMIEVWDQGCNDNSVRSGSMIVVPDQGNMTVVWNRAI